MSLLLTLGLGGGATPPTPPSGGDTPYMNLLLPTVSVTLGPLYATEVNQAFLRVDSHDHSDGYGKLVGTNGLNINAPLSFHGNDATNLNSAGFNIQSPTAGLTGSVYMSGQDLYCVDGAGNVIQITASGAVNVSGLGSWTGLIAPAEAGYNSVTKKFTLKSNTTGPVYGLLAVGDILLYPGDPNLGTLPYIRIATPNAGVATYTLQLPPAVPAGVGNKKLMLLNNDGTCTLGPTLPSVTSFMRMDNTGTPAADVIVDTATMQLAGSGPYVLGVKPGGITNVQITDNTLEPRALKVVGATGSISATSTSSASPVLVGAATMTASGKCPIQVSIATTGPFPGFKYIDSLSAGTQAFAELYLDGVLVNQAMITAQVVGVENTFPMNCIACVLPPPTAGVRIFTVKIWCNGGGSASVSCTAATITVQEI